MFEVIVEKEGMEFLGWREVPTDPTTMGQKAIDCMPYIMQGFVKRPKDCQRELILTESSMLQDVYLNRVMTTPMWYHSQAERLFTRECS